jgi:hypothetical protein
VIHTKLKEKKKKKKEVHDTKKIVIKYIPLIYFLFFKGPLMAFFSEIVGYKNTSRQQ